MIYSLRRKLIGISSASVTAVFLLIFGLICLFSLHQLNSAMDMLTDRIADNDGAFPPFDGNHPPPPDGKRFPDFFTEETRFMTRFFTVHLDEAGNILSENVEAVSSVTRETAREYALEVLGRQKERGWIGGYRYKQYEHDAGRGIVFVDGKANRSISRMTLLSVAVVLIGSLILIIILILIFSKRAVKPIAEGYEKQKQFITDANHELKTPLTLILTNLDIVEAEVGRNEWLEDIRAEGERMNALVQQLVTLTRMDEEGERNIFPVFSISETITDTLSEFQALAEHRGLGMDAQIQPAVMYEGDEEAIRRVVGILLDNAVKYCDPGGRIEFLFFKKKKLMIRVENSCRNVRNMELNRLFDRFYRGDSSRPFDGSFGIGLSIAKAIVEKHHGEISVYARGTDRIGFQVTLRSKKLRE